MKFNLRGGRFIGGATGGGPLGLTGGRGLAIESSGVKESTLQLLYVEYIF